MHILEITTKDREEMINITSKVQQLLDDNTYKNGGLMLWCPHTTAALTVNEAADPAVARDIIYSLHTLVPAHGDYKHAEGNSDAHIKASLTGQGLTLMTENSQLVLGTWQGIFFCEFDGPRTRKIFATWLG